MTIDEKDMINSILAGVSRIDYIKPEDIPTIMPRINFSLHRRRSVIPVSIS